MATISDPLGTSGFQRGLQEALRQQRFMDSQLSWRRAFDSMKVLEQLRISAPPGLSSFQESLKDLRVPRDFLPPNLTADLARSAMALSDSMRHVSQLGQINAFAGIAEQLRQITISFPSVPSFANTFNIPPASINSDLAGIAAAVAKASLGNLPSPFIDRLSAAIEEANNQDPERSVAETLTKALASASSESPSIHVDWKFWFNFLVALVLFLYADNKSNKTEQRLSKALQEARDETASVATKADIILKALTRPASLSATARVYGGPRSGAPVVVSLAEGTEVLLLRRSKKWSLIAWTAEDSTLSTGWIRNKYLAY